MEQEIQEGPLAVLVQGAVLLEHAEDRRNGAAHIFGHFHGEDPFGGGPGRVPRRKTHADGGAAGEDIMHHPPAAAQTQGRDNMDEVDGVDGVDWVDGTDGSGSALLATRSSRLTTAPQFKRRHTSAALCGRSCGCFARHAAIVSSQAAGIPGPPVPATATPNSSRRATTLGGTLFCT